MGGSDGPCCVDIVPARMHDARVYRGKVEARVFLNRECVDVTAHRNDGYMWITTLDTGYDPRIGDAIERLGLESPEVFVQLRRGPFFLKRKLRVTM